MLKGTMPSLGLALCLPILLSLACPALANGGPFVVKYPSGDPAAKGILARLDPSLKPQVESRLRVVKEDLKVTFVPELPPQVRAPVANVSAAYTIENPTASDIEVDFGFPILRGIYVSPFAMMPAPEVQVQVDGKPAQCVIISNSAIYGIIRQRARREIDRGIARDGELARLMFAVHGAEGEARAPARAALGKYLTGRKKWNQRDAALLVEYAGLDFGSGNPLAVMGWSQVTDSGLRQVATANLGPLAAIGDQKATQLFAQLAGRFGGQAAAGYEALFAAWGGDVRERSVDLRTGQVRPREIAVDPKALDQGPSTVEGRVLISDPTVYARVDYLDSNASITDDERAACKAILANLPVVFTFAPMNLLHYRVKFPAGSTQVLTVTYSQYPYADTAAPASYQLAYVVHPASLWKSFGPISLEVAVPEGVGFRASEACAQAAPEERPLGPSRPSKMRFDIYRGEVTRKSGELFLAVDAGAWKKACPPLSLAESHPESAPSAGAPAHPVSTAAAAAAPAQPVRAGK